MKNIVCGVLGLVLITGVARAQDAAEMFDWKLQPPIGLRGRYTTFTHMKIAQNLPAMPAAKNRPQTFAQRMEIESQQTFIIDYETISRDLKGGTVSRLTYRTLKRDSKVKINGKPVSMSQMVPMKGWEKIFDSLQIDIKQGPDGRVWNVQGVEKMRRRLEAAFPQHDAASRATMKSAFDSIVSQKTLRQSWDVASKYPANPVRVGESWTYQTPFEMAAMKLNLHGTRQLIALKDNFATISERANLKLQLDDLPSAQSSPNAPQVEMSGGGITRGKTIVNRETGMEIENFGTLRMITTTKVNSVAKGRTDTMEMPQWFLMQIHRVFRTNP